MVLQELVKSGNGASVGSVGKVGVPAYDRNNNRVKGIFTTVVHDRNGLSAVFSRVKEAERENPQADRTTFRAFVNRGLIQDILKTQQLAEQEGRVSSDPHLRMDGTSAQFADSIRRAKDAMGIDLAYNIEGVICTNGTVSGCDLVYFGKNSASRTPKKEIRELEEASLHEAKQARTTNPPDAYARLENGKYAIEVINGSTSQADIETMLSLYKEAYSLYTFPINHETIRIMLGNGNRAYVARGEDGQISSVLVAEQATLRLDDGSTVNMYELSDFATFRKDRGHGIITALQIRATEDLRASDPHAIVYAEDRAPWKAVNKSSRQAGLEHSGTLQFHCSIIADRDFSYTTHGEGHENYETLNVWAAPPAQKGQ